jgi:DNA-binding MurR/RpiR family transcriptional regulator
VTIMKSGRSVARVDGTGSAPLLVRLRALRPSLSPAEDRVAEQVLADPRGAAAKTISELAAVATTSETTVLRFCKRLGLSGYPRLRLALAEESARPRVQKASQTNISATDSIDDMIRKVAFVEASAVEETAQQLDRGLLAESAKLIDQAARIDIYGSGASAVVADDLQQKLHRIGRLAFAWSDPHVALASAALLGSRDFAIGISHSGTTRETIESIVVASASGARTAAITNFPLSPLAQAADIVLTTVATETLLRTGATASRIAALTVVDCLYTAVAQRNLRSARKAVRSSRAAVSEHKVG